MIKYVTIFNWALLPDDAVLHETAEALEIAKQFGDDFQLANAEFTHGLALIRSDEADRDYGFGLLEHVRQTVLNHRYIMIAAFCVDLDVAAEKIRTEDYDGAIELCRSVLDKQIRSGEGINRGWATTVLVDALLRRRSPRRPRGGAGGRRPAGGDADRAGLPLPRVTAAAAQRDVGRSPR